MATHLPAELYGQHNSSDHAREFSESAAAACAFRRLQHLSSYCGRVIKYNHVVGFKWSGDHREQPVNWSHEGRHDLEVG